ncbi:hypothetical protein CYMTET_16821 [Cymbomonas tetramitiformis]|uniref:Uncharacterized protein n=1 Tax=Cymbomonas tetramitiformis TaxID=36881 RepID=A0AAE0GBT9_9CHLO|nr:hypothetical protein CYMTET_16821 [Cymbomonas tetramitiformis]
MQGELDAVMAQSSKLTNQLERSFQEAATQRETLSDTQMALDMAEADLTAAQDRVKIGEKQMESVKAENAELRRSHTKQRQHNQQKLNACNMEVDRLQNWKEWAERASLKQLEVEKAAARELVEKLSEVEAEGARRKGEVRQLQETVWVERTRAAELKVELASSRRSSEQLQAELAAAADAVAKSRQDATEASMETARVEARLEIDRFRVLEKEHRMNRDLHVRKALSAAWEREAKLLGNDEASKHHIVPLLS